MNPKHQPSAMKPGTPKTELPPSTQLRKAVFGGSHYSRRDFLRQCAAAAVTLSIVICAALPCFGEPVPFGDVLSCELESNLVLDGRYTLAGKFTPQKSAAARAALSSAPIRGLRIRLVPLSPEGRSWETQLEATADRLKEGLPFTLPTRELRGGYYRMHGELFAEGDALVAKGSVTAFESTPVMLCVLQLRPAQPSSPNPKPRDYISFVTQTVERLLERQSVTLGGQPDGTRFITVARPVQRSYRELGRKLSEGIYTNHWFPEAPLDYEPFLADLEAWVVLERLSALTGNEHYRTLTGAMAQAFARHGFHPMSGLGYLGTENGFDVLRVEGVSTMQFRGIVLGTFKPRNSGTYPQLPLEQLWTHAPAQMHRMCRAMYYGMVTDAATMDFNRYCGFEFNDADQVFSMKPNPNHGRFNEVAGRMIHWWASCFARTGDADCLAWAQKMTDKWQAVQHAKTGLTPFHCGSSLFKLPPDSTIASDAAALTAASYLDAATELRKRPGGKPLADQLTQMAVKVALGVARQAYDPKRRIFRARLICSGKLNDQGHQYENRPQSDKDAAVKLEPPLEQWKVFYGAGFYQPGVYWEHFAGSTVPLDLAQVMAATGNEELAAILRTWVPDLIEEGRKQRSAITADGTWTFRASGEYIHMLVLLWRQTKDLHYLDAAREIADREIAGLEQVEYPEWWRMPERTALLDGLLALHEAMATQR